MGIKSSKEWAEETFGHAELNDARRTKRLVKVAEGYANHIGGSTVTSCEGDDAQIEGAYRFFRNEQVDVTSILDAGFESTRRKALGIKELIAIEDTTSLSYKHKVVEELGYTSNSLSSKTKGFEVHSVLLVNVQTEKTVGLIEQNWWVREEKDFGKRKASHKRAYESKESYKWERASRQMSERLEEKMHDVISVCDRESDINHYLKYKEESSQRYVLRSKTDRIILGNDKKLYETLACSPVLGEYTVEVGQKGGRKGRTATCHVHALSVCLKIGDHINDELHTNAILIEEVVEKETEENKLQWILLTTEDVSNFELARTAIRYYELRWRIEDFHKAWKSGVGVERLRHQQKENLQRSGSILAFVAVRLLQLRELAGYSKEEKELAKSMPCTVMLREDEWKVLWLTHNKKSKKLPKEPPNIVWAYHAVGKLGGWYDSKRTGIVGWKALWKGWFRLGERLEGYSLFQKMQNLV